MSIAQPVSALRLASLTLVFSVPGGLVGYLIGAFVFDLAQSSIIDWGYQTRFQAEMSWPAQRGFLAVLVAGFSLAPCKISTIAAGIPNLALLPFLLASVIGRGARSFLLACGLSIFGPAIEPRLIKYIELIDWSIVVALLLAMVVYYF